MKKSSTIKIVFILLMAAKTALVTGYPITVTCVDNETQASTKLVVQLNLLAHEGTLHYESPHREYPLKMSIDKPMGIYSSSLVTLQSFMKSGYMDEPSLEISAQRKEVMRVVHFSLFNLVLEQNSSGAYLAKKLSYERGIDAFPDSNQQETIELPDLICSITGL